MSNETHQHQTRKDSRTERWERLAQELRANLLKRKALARARRTRAQEMSREDAEEKAS